MKYRRITLPELALIAGTRALLGAGVGLLVSEHLDTKQRRALGWTLTAIGALSTIPLATQVIFKRESQVGDPAQLPESPSEEHQYTAQGSTF